MAADPGLVTIMDGLTDTTGTSVSTTWGSGSNPSHQYNANGVYTVTLYVSESNGNWGSSQSFVTVNSVSLPARINFDELPNNTVVADQYLSQYGVRFYSGNSFYPVHTYQNCGPCATTSPPNYIVTKPDDAGQTTVEFTQPVSNLTFYMIGVDAFFNQFSILDVYRNNALYATYPVYGNGTRTVGVNLGSLTDISKVVIRGINDPLGIGFDDFTFTIPSDIKITNARVSGYLNGTTQNALAGADVALNATPIPAGFAGGTYSWAFSGPVQSVGSLNSSSVTIKSLDVGTITGNVSYTKNGLTATASVTINAVLPSLTNFTAQQGTDLVAPPGQCRSDNFWWYKLGCVLNGQIGMNFSSSVHAPTFISDPSQSGIKYVQAVSAFRKKNRVGLRCDTRRSSESDVASGWQLDTEDPYVFLPEFPVHRFSEGNDLTMLTVDNPANAVTFILPKEFIDVLYIDDRFEMYVVYFTGSNPAAPGFQRPVGKLAWNWGGLVVLDWNGQDAIHHLRYSNASPGPRTGVSVNSMVAMQGNVRDNPDVACPAGSPLTNNNIDSSRVFVKYHYLDFLGRDPAGDSTHQADPVGWNFWTSTISQCVFDLNCIHAQRIGIGLAFFYSAEFIGTDPDMAHPPGTAGFNAPVYNRRFVFWCYKKYLLRDPDPEGWDYWTSVLNSEGNYGHIIESFQVSGAYRDRNFN